MIPRFFIDHIFFHPVHAEQIFLDIILLNKFNTIIKNIIHTYYNFIFNNHTNFFINFLKNSSQYKSISDIKGNINTFYNFKIKQIDIIFRKDIRTIKNLIIHNLKFSHNTNTNTNTNNLLKNKYKTLYLLMNQKKKEIITEKQNLILQKKREFINNNIQNVEILFFMKFYNKHIVNNIYNANLNFLISLKKSNSKLNIYEIFNIFNNIVKKKWDF